MAPAERPVFGLIVVGQPLFTGMVAAHGEIEVSAEFVTLAVIGDEVGSPWTVGIDVSGKGEVNVVADGPIISSVFQIESAHAFFSVGGHDNTRSPFLGDGKKGKRQGNGEGDILNH